MIDRVFKNTKTTIAGIALFVSGIVLVALEKATLTEAGAFFGVAFALFFSKDSINGKRL
jgi:drug/metabolite transporter (DMT)-like permease